VWKYIGVIFRQQFIFTSKSRSRKCYPLLDFHCIFVIFCSNNKSLRFNSYPISMPIFSFLTLAVYPIGMTTYWCYFLQIIIYNIVTIYDITTKFCIRMCHKKVILKCHGAMYVYILYVKIALLFFLLITHGCGALASLAAQHTTMCLDYICPS